MTDMERLLAIMARLRDPQQGCPWDRQQDFRSIAPYTLEEAYEVVDAIEREDIEGLRDELGDLLLQVVFHARMAEERGAFSFTDAVRAINDKLLHRHPHVFGDAKFPNLQAQKHTWESRKAEERIRKHSKGALVGIPTALPALSRAAKLQQRAARVGFDWETLPPVLAKIREELAELEQELNAGAPGKRVLDEVGDVLFAVANLARKLNLDPEQALRGTNLKFERRFQRVEQVLVSRGSSPEEATLEEMDAIWEQAKRDGL